MTRLVERADAWSVPGRTVAAAVLVLVLVAVHAAYPTVDAWARATAVLFDGVFRAPVSPAEWVTDEPRRGEVTWAPDGRGVLVLPAGEGPHPAFILALGARAASPDDPRVVDLTDALARAGFVTLMPQSDDLDAGRVLPQEVDRLAGAFAYLRAHPDVDGEHVGFVGLSAGGSLSMVAAAQPEIAADVWLVLALGPYEDAGRLAAEVVSQTYREPDGDLVSWEPRRISREVVRETLLSTLEPAQRAAVETGAEPETDAARTVDALLAGPSLGEADALIDGAGEETARTLRAISPRHHLGGLRAPLYLVHDRADEFVPWPHSEDIAAAYPPEVYHRTDLFEHVEPRIDAVGPLLRDGWRLLRMFAGIIREAR